MPSPPILNSPDWQPLAAWPGGFDALLPIVDGGANVSFNAATYTSAGA